MGDHCTLKAIKSLPFKANFQDKPEFSIWC